MPAVPIVRADHDAAGLRKLAARAGDANAARRLLSIALVLEGTSRPDAARAAGMDRQTLRDRVHRDNAGGPEALSNRRAPGRAPSLTPEQTEQVAAWVQTGPDLEADGVVRWRRKDPAARGLLAGAHTGACPATITMAGPTSTRTAAGSTKCPSPRP